jgi:hypothetical protein
MTTSDREARETRRIEEHLRHQLRWIEDDILITLSGPDERSQAAENGWATRSAAVSPTIGRTGKPRLLARLRRWSADRLRSVAAVLD